MRRRRAALVLALALTAACAGEPAVPLEVPVRADGAQVLDLAGIVDDEALAARLSELREAGHDTVAVTWETPEASMGMADRLGRKVLDTWDADIALVAVAVPGDFDASGEERDRFFGLFAREVRAVPAGLREHIAEELVPPIAARNDWDDAFREAAAALADGLAG